MLLEFSDEFLKNVYISGFFCAYELIMCAIEIFLGILSCLGEKQADENIADFNFLVIFVLQTGFGYRVEEAFPSDDFKVYTPFPQLVV